MYIRRAIELSAIHKRRYFEKRRNGAGLLRTFLDEWLEPYPVSRRGVPQDQRPSVPQDAQAGGR